MTKGRVFAAAAAVIALSFFAQTASAQYPIPRGNLTCGSSQVNVQFGGVITVSARLFDTFGNPYPNQLVYFNVSSLNAPFGGYGGWGSGYGLSSATAITDFGGFAAVSLNVPLGGSLYSPISSSRGYSAGAYGYGNQIFVSATSGGLACQASVLRVDPTPSVIVVQSPAPAIYQAPAVYRQEVASAIIPPRTGSAGLLPGLDGTLE